MMVAQPKFRNFAVYGIGQTAREGGVCGCVSHQAPSFRRRVSHHQLKGNGMDKTPPAATLRDGNLKATIWQNEGEKGPYFSTDLTRSYRDDDGNFQDTRSFGSNDLLRVSELARQAHQKTVSMRRELRGKDDDRTADVAASLEERRSTRGRGNEKDRER